MERRYRFIIQRIKKVWPALLTGAALAGGFVPNASGAEKLQRVPAGRNPATITILDMTMLDRLQGVVDRDEPSVSNSDQKPGSENTVSEQRIPKVPYGTAF